MKTLILFIGILTWVISTSIPIVAQDQAVSVDATHYNDDEKEVNYHAPTDTTTVVIKNFDKKRIADLISDPSFNYQEPPTMAESLWDRFLQWITQFFRALFDGATGTNWGRVLVYAAAFVGFVIILLMILRVNAFRVFYSGADKGVVSTSLFHEDIHEMDFEKLIQDAIAEQKYREGIRLIFLHSLKLLTDRQLIHWQAGKTNHDYVAELAPGDVRVNLNELSFYFDYAWYGNFPVKEEAFKKTQLLFLALKQTASR